MNPREHELENVLRAAPRPTPPAGLKQRLVAQVRLPAIRPAAQIPSSPLTASGWLARWWPVLAPAAASVACAIGLGVQQLEIRNLKQAIQDLSRELAPKPALAPSPMVQTNDAVPQADATARTQQEIARLRELAAQLGAEVAQLEQLRADNIRLRTELAAPPPGLLSAEETEALAEARERAEAVYCVNNLKQMALAMRVWAIDNEDTSPPDMLSMSNELNSPKILTCPGDRAREAAKDWTSYTQAHGSYEYLVPSVLQAETEPLRVAFRCPVHGTIALCDGSVQRGLAKEHPERLVQHNGKLYLADPSEAGPPVNPTSGGTNQ